MSRRGPISSTVLYWCLTVVTLNVTSTIRVWTGLRTFSKRAPF